MKLCQRRQTAIQDFINSSMVTVNRMDSYHRPALVREVTEILSVGPGCRCIDATVGDGGHAMALLEATAPDGRLLGIDADPKSLERAQSRLKSLADRVTLVNENFANLKNVAVDREFYPAAGILMDLGLSSWQLFGSGRGFSFGEDVPLDMRLSPDQPISASVLVNTLPVVELAQIITTYGEEPQARRIAQSIVRHRPINNALELARSIEAVVHRRGRRIHPATRTFQAIRMVVNRELENLELALDQAVNLLAVGGRLAVIAYHSLEDRVVKTFMRREARDCICPPSHPECTCSHKASVKILTRKVVKPSNEETLSNPRIRSARLRACVRSGAVL